jgi:outer membrane protein OmpA-like peptidoglycan-associated protein
VQNPDFEIVVKMPYGKNRQIDCAKGWRNPTFAGSDYYHMDGDKHAGTSQNDFGEQSPHSGKAYGGICITKEYIEYLATTLTDTLIKGHDYLVELYISRAEKSKSNVGEFGVLFTNRIKWSLEMKGISQKPSVDFVKKKRYKDKKSWIRLSGIYHAEGSETVIIIGYFNYNSPKGHKRFCHYYIDNVSVTPVIQEKNSVTHTQIVEIEEKEEPAFSPKSGETFTLQHILFENNKAGLLLQAYPELDKLVQYLNRETTAGIEISGHTDNTGNENQNKILSEARAKTVADYLILKGIDQTRISYFGHGSTKPIATNDTEEGKLQNRRVEFTIIKK